MHMVALQLAPVLAAEKSKVPFYVAGGALVAWALLVSLALGLRKADFPGNLPGQRAVSAITAVLVLAAASTAVITSGSPAKSAAATPGEQQPASTSRSEPAPSTASSSVAPTPTGSTAPTAPTPTATTPAATTPAVKPAAAAGSELALAANPGGQLAFDAKQLSAKAGSVTIKLTNASPLEHNVTIAQEGTVLGATPTFSNGAKTVTVKLRPGTYTFYCSVPGHRQAGMEGTLTVS